VPLVVVCERGVTRARITSLALASDLLAAASQRGTGHLWRLALDGRGIGGGTCVHASKVGQGAAGRTPRPPEGPGTP
jgi:hypothetical protein